MVFFRTNAAKNSVWEQAHSWIFWAMSWRHPSAVFWNLVSAFAWQEWTLQYAFSLNKKYLVDHYYTTLRHLTFSVREVYDAKTDKDGNEVQERLKMVINCRQQTRQNDFAYRSKGTNEKHFAREPTARDNCCSVWSKSLHGFRSFHVNRLHKKRRLCL